MCKFGHIDITSGPDPGNGFQESDNRASHYSISNRVCIRSNDWPRVCGMSGLFVGVVNWVIGRLPVTHSGRNNAQGLRSVNTIFRRHDQMSRRPKLSVHITPMLSTCFQSVSVRGFSTHQAAAMARFASEGTNQCLCEVKPL